MRRQVVVTGIGVLTSVAANKIEYIDALKKGTSGIKEITLFDTQSYKNKRGGEIDKEILEDYFSERERRKLDRASQLVLLSADMAVRDSGLSFDRVDKDRCGIILGTTLGGVLSGEKFYRKLFHHCTNNKDFLLLLEYPPYVSAYHVASKYNLRGIVETISTACSSSGHAIGLGMREIQNEKMNVMIVGGFDVLSEFAFAGFESLGLLSSDIKPFDKNRKGFVLGEGAGILVIELLEHALARGANIYCELCGYGASSDAYSMTISDPAGKGFIRAMELAIRDSNIKLKEIEYVNAHGVGIKMVDLIETRAIKKVFGDLAYRISISSTKSMVGHTLGASGAIEIIAAILGLNYDFIPPTINYEFPDSECDLFYVPNRSIEKQVNVVMSNSFGFGGSNCVIIAKKYLGERISKEKYYFKFKKSMSKNNRRKEIVITGTGVIMPSRVGIDLFWNHLKEGRSRFGKITGFNTRECKSELGGEIESLYLDKFDKDFRFLRLPKASQLAIVATASALSDADLNHSVETGGIFYGSDSGVLKATEDIFRNLLEDGILGIHTWLFPETVFNAPAAHCSIRNKIKGPTLAFATGCVSGILGIVKAADFLQQDGSVDWMVAVASEELTKTRSIAEWYLGKTSPQGDGIEISCPFDARRNGSIISEGGAALVLETKDHAIKRSAKIYGKIKGIGISFGRYIKGREQQFRKGIELAIEKALNDANMVSKDIHCIISGAYSDRVCDRIESEAIKNVLGEFANKVPVTNIKSLIGETCSVSGILSTIASFQIIKTNLVFPIANLIHVDPNCEGLNYVIHFAQKKEIANVLINCYEYRGGSIISMIVSKG